MYLSVIFAYSFETKQATVLKFWQMIDDIVGGAQKVLWPNVKVVTEVKVNMKKC